MAIDMIDIEGRLRRLEDIEEIRGLRMRYHYCINEGRSEDTAAIFTDDAYVEYEGVAVAKGRSEFSRVIPSLSKSPSEKGLSDRDFCDSRGLRDLIWSYHVDPGHPAAT